MECVLCDDCPMVVNNNNKILYEVHITVDPKDVEQFKKDCKIINVKPLLIDLHNNTMQMMTSSFVETHGFSELFRVKGMLKYLGYNVVRTKLETVPWHPDVPSLLKDKNIFSFGHKSDNYFECHLPVKIKETELNPLKNLFNIYNVHMSNNVFKRHEDGYVTIMGSVRDFIKCKEEFELDVKGIIDGIELTTAGRVVKKIIEYVIHDSNLQYDGEWGR